MNPAQFTYEIGPLAAPGCFLLKLAGSVDIKSSSELEQIGRGLIVQGNECLMLDLSEVDYINSQGLGAILYLQRNLEAGGGGVVIVAASFRIRPIFEVTGLNRAVPMYTSLNEALECDRLCQGKMTRG